MDLTYGPGELDYTGIKKGSGPDMKREHDSVDDFEHLEPEISPIGLNTKDLPLPEKSDILFKSDPDSDENLLESSLPKNVKDEFSLFSKGLEPLATGTGISAGMDFLSDFESESQEAMSKDNFSMKKDSDQSHLLDFGMGAGIPSTKSDVDLEENDALHTSFISAEKDNNFSRADKESDVSTFGANDKGIMDFGSSKDSPNDNTNEEKFKPEEPVSVEKKSMKEDDALAQYNVKLEKKENEIKDIKDNQEATLFSSNERLEPEPMFREEAQEINSDADLVKPSEIQLPKPEPKQSETSKTDSSTIADTFTMHEDIPIIPASVSKSSPTPTNTVIQSISKTSAADLDDIIGPEDVFKKIGLGE